MWLCYIDECGNTGKKLDPKQPQHMLVAVMVPEEHVRPLGEALNAIVREALGDTPERVELHAIDMYGLCGPWAALDHEGMNKVYRSALSTLGRFDCAVAHATINKAELKRQYGGTLDPHMIGLQFLVEKIDIYLRTMKEPGRQLGLLIADEIQQKDYAITMVSDMQRYGSPFGLTFSNDRIIDSLHFVRSKDNPGVQLADLVAYCLGRTRRMPDPPEKPGDIFMRDAYNQLVLPHVRKYRTAWP